jgi:hypothetical protein
MANIAPAQRLGKAANLIIFLGIFYAMLHLLALSGATALAQSGYGLLGLAIAIGIGGLGYGIRYGSVVCLYMAIGVFAGLSVYFFALLVSSRTLAAGLRFVLSSWAVLILYRALPAMKILRVTHAFPLPMSRYGAWFVHRWSGKRGRAKGEERL